LNKHVQKVLLDAYFKSRGLVSHNIESFNKFMEFGIQRVVDEIGEVASDILPPGCESLKIKFGRVYVEPPSIIEADGTKRVIYPMEARLRDLTYEAPLFMEMTLIKDDVELETNRHVYIGSIPILLKSKYCHLYGKSREELISLGEDPDDPGGYFIINGTERLIVTVEDLAPNKPFVERKDGPFPYVAKIFSEARQAVVHEIERRKDGIIFVSFARVHRIPFPIIMKALGVTKDKEILELCGGEEFFNEIYLNLYHTADIRSREDALEFIGRKIGITQEKSVKIQRSIEMLDKFFLPHLGSERKDRIFKAYYLGRAIKKLLMVATNRLSEDDKDHYANKRLRLCGDLMESLFRVVFRVFVSDIKYSLERIIRRGKIPSVETVVRAQQLTSRIRSAMATGEWVGERTGICQALNRLNQYILVSQLRRVVSLLTSGKENFEARDVHPTHYGRICPAHTPEGINVGLRKHLALMCEVSTEPSISDEKLERMLEKIGLRRIS